jgi:hypothetical protein
MRQASNSAGDTGRTALDGAGLEKALADGKFEQSTSHLTGMVKPSGNSGHVSFTLAGCRSWVDIPSSMITDARYVGKQVCEDHSHPVFQLSIEPTNAESRALMQLLSAGAASPLSMFMPPPGAGGLTGMDAQAEGISQLRKPQCTSWCVGSTLMCMCPVYIPRLGMAYVIYSCGTCIDDPVFTAFA